MSPSKEDRWPLAFLGLAALVLAWSAVKPHDYFTWFLEVLPALLAVPPLLMLYPRLRFTNLWDMFTCLIGALTGLLTLSRFHDRQLADLKG